MNAGCCPACVAGKDGGGELRFERHATAVNCVIARALRTRFAGASAPNLFFRKSSPKTRASKSRDAGKSQRKRLKILRSAGFFGKCGSSKMRDERALLHDVRMSSKHLVPALLRQILLQVAATFLPLRQPLCRCHNPSIKTSLCSSANNPILGCPGVHRASDCVSLARKRAEHTCRTMIYCQASHLLLKLGQNC